MNHLIRQRCLWIILLFIIALLAPASVSAQCVPAPDPDLNNDGIVSLADLYTVTSKFGLNSGEPGYDPIADTNCDGTIDSTDAVFVQSAMGQTFPPEDEEDNEPPVLSITAPASGSTITDNPPLIQVSYSDEGSGVDQSTLAFSVNSSPISVSCTFEDTGADCTPELAFPDGSITLSAAISDQAGNTAEAESQFEIVPPGVDNQAPDFNITRPIAGALIIDNQHVIEITYSDESGVDISSLTFTANNQSIDVDCQLTSSGGNCTPLNPLPEGGVTLEAMIDDTLGNTATADVQFTVDSLPVEINIISPEDGFITKEEIIEVVGSVGTSVTAVRVNDVEAALSGSTFTANVPLREGTNMLVAVGTKTSSKTGTDSVDVTRDIFAPVVRITTPSNGFVSPNDKIAVAGQVNDIVNGATNPNVKVNGIEATVSDGSFMVVEVPLVRGPNIIEAVGTDVAGNESRHSISVTFQQPVGARMTVGGGNGQSGIVNQTLAEPLVAVVKDSLNNPIAGRVVHFEVTRNNGVVRANASDTPKRVVQVPTDGSGKAQVLFTIGDTAGEGNNRVVATALGVTGQVEFCASAVAANPDKILMVSGDNQRGVVGSPLANPLEALVIDIEGNPIKGINVTFTVEKGNGNLNGQQSLVRTTGTDGIARTVLTLGLEPGINNNVVNASFESLAGLPATFTASGLAPGNPADTRFSGVVLDNGHTPIPNAVVSINDTTVSDITDEKGQFSLENVPVGHIHLHIDPSGSPRPETFPPLEFETVTVAGQNNTLGQPILLPAVDTVSSKIVGGDEDVTLQMPAVAGLELTVFANSATFPDGSKTGRLSISQVHLDKVPMPPPNGTIFMPPAWTIQPAGVVFDPPAAISIPNDGLPPGRVIDIFQFDHTLNEFINVGKGTVSDDGLVIVSDPGYGITRTGWGGCGQPQPPNTCASGCDDGNPCTDDKCQNNSCVHTNISDGTACESDSDKSFSAKGVNIKLDKSCSKGTCKAGKCEPKSDRWGFNNLQNATTDALCKIFDNCIGDPLKTTMQDNLKDKGFSISCVDSNDSNANGNPDCGSAALGGNTLKIGNQSVSTCGSLPKTIRHEMQHGAGNRSHTADVADDTVFACDLSCYGTANKAGADPANCK